MLNKIRYNSNLCAGNLLNNVYFHNCKNFLGFYKHLFLGKLGTSFFNFSSLRLKQWNKVNAITENYITFLVGLQSGSFFHGLGIIKAAIS